MTITGNTLQAIFFDFDGVIIDSTSVKTKGFRTLFAEYEGEIVDRVVEYHRLHGGISRVEKIRFAHSEIIGTPLSDNQLDAWAKRYSEIVVQDVLAVDWVAGAREFLDFSITKVKNFLVSGTPYDELQYIVEQRGIRHCFQEVLGSPTKKVPHILMVLDNYGLQSDRCVFIGDAMTDYNAAEETGLHFIGIRGENVFPASTTLLGDCTGLNEAIAEIFNWPPG